MIIQSIFVVMGLVAIMITFAVILGYLGSIFSREMK